MDWRTIPVNSKSIVWCHAKLVWLCILSIGFNQANESYAATGPEYRFGPGDQIVISVFGEDDLSMEFRLGDTGALNYPFLGEIRIAGLTPKELEQSIDSGLRGPYLVDPKVTVSVKEYRLIYVRGAVNKPGGYPFQPGLTVEKAITLAGGFTERASTTRVEINREQGASNGGFRTSLADLVMPGDVVTTFESFF